MFSDCMCTHAYDEHYVHGPCTIGGCSCVKYGVSYSIPVNTPILPKPELTIELLLENACSNPFDGVDLSNALTALNIHPVWNEYEWNKYEIELHCMRLTVIARELGEGKYELLDYTLIDN